MKKGNPETSQFMRSLGVSRFVRARALTAKMKMVILDKNPYTPQDDSSANSLEACKPTD
jgi:hypothetical protein